LAVERAPSAEASPQDRFVLTEGALHAEEWKMLIARVLQLRKPSYARACRFHVVHGVPKSLVWIISIRNRRIQLASRGKREREHVGFRRNRADTNQRAVAQSKPGRAAVAAGGELGATK